MMGNKHRKLLGSKAKNFYKWLKKENFPAGFQTLCANCNLKKKIIAKE